MNWLVFVLVDATTHRQRKARLSWLWPSWCWQCTCTDQRRPALRPAPEDSTPWLSVWPHSLWHRRWPCDPPGSVEWSYCQAMLSAVDERTDGWICGLVHLCSSWEMDGWSGLVLDYVADWWSRRCSKGVDISRDRWMGEWMSRWMDGWINEWQTGEWVLG